MQINQLADLTGVSPKTIRYYEMIGLVRPAERRLNGYRSYSVADMHTLHFIKRARSLGFSVEEVRELLDLWHNRKRTSAAVTCALRSERVSALNASTIGRYGSGVACCSKQAPRAMMTLFGSSPARKVRTSVVLPMPGSPVTKHNCRRPLRTRSSAACSAFTSVSRPTTSGTNTAHAMLPSRERTARSRCASRERNRSGVGSALHLPRCLGSLTLLHAGPSRRA